MLILTRRPTQAVKIGSDVTLTILEIRGSQVRMAVSAPDESAAREEPAETRKVVRRTPDAAL
jgi:carbon storage regulator